MGMPEPGVVNTIGASNIQETSFDMTGDVVDFGVNADPVEKGFVYFQGTSGDPTTTDSNVFTTNVDLGEYTLPITGLTANTSYRARAYLVNSAGTDYGLSITVTTAAPAAPSTAPVLSSSSKTSTSISLSWNTVTGADTYELQRDTVTIQNTSAITLDDTGRTPNTEYSYRVRGVNGTGPGPWSNVLAVTTEMETYSGTALLSGAGSFALAAGDKFSSGSGLISKTGSINASGSKTISSEALVISASDSLTATSQVTIPLNPPTNITVLRLTDTSIQIDWTAASNADIYRLMRERFNSVSWVDQTVVSEDIQQTTYLDENLESGSIYRYRLASGGIENISYSPALMEDGSEILMENNNVVYME